MSISFDAITTAGFPQDISKCSACGARQQNKFGAECFNCGAKFRRKGR